MKKIVFIVSCISILFTSCSKDSDIIIDPNPTVPSVPIEIAIDSTQTFNEILSGQSEADRLGLWFKYSDFEPTGVYVKPNATLKLEVSLLQGESLPTLLVGTYSRGDFWNKTPIEYSLQSGENTVNIDSEGGMVYVRYTKYNNPSGNAKIKFVSGWEHSPVFRLDKTSSKNWKKMLNAFSEVPSVTIIGNKCMLVVSRDNAIAFQDENLNNLLNSIDDVIDVQNVISGMDGSSSLHMPMSHKLLFSEYTGSDYYMFAYNFRTAYNNTGVQFILSEQKFKDEGWGPWHELGHMHQMSAWTWDEIVESTVNIYSLASEKSMGISPSRLRRENKWENIEMYLALDEADKNFNGDSIDVWTRLGMFYQLQLAYGDFFYINLHKIIREKNPETNSDEDRMRVFMLNACLAANKDLTVFFKDWGLKFSSVNAVYNEIAELELDVPNLDLTQLQD